MNIIIKKPLNLVVLSLIILIVFVFSLHACTDCSKAVDKESGYKNVKRYYQEIDQLLKNKYDAEASKTSPPKEEFKENNLFMSSSYLIGDDVYIIFTVQYFEGRETFKFIVFADADEYGQDNSGLDYEMIANILNVISGHPYSQEELTGFVENAIINKIVNYVADEKGYEIDDSKSIGHYYLSGFGYADAWKIKYQVQFFTYQKIFQARF